MKSRNAIPSRRSRTTKTAPAPGGHSVPIRTARSPFFQLLVLANLTARPFYERFGRRMHLSLSEWRVLLVVADRPGISAQDLADYIGLDKMSVSRAVRGLESRKRLVRRASNSDRRSRLLYLTAEGWRIYREIAASGLARERAVFGALPARERRAFFAKLTQLVARTRGLDQKP